VIGLLRFVGLINAAIWFGAAIFFTFGGAEPGNTGELSSLLGPKNAPFFSVAIGQLITARYFHLYLACSAIAWLHLMAEWLYFGRYPKRLWLALLVGLCLSGVVQSFWLQPRLKEWHRLRYSGSQLKDAAGHAYGVWHGVSTVLNVTLVCGLVVYLWGVANPPDPTRFVSATKFRS
jgi:hypothetical protein